MSIWKKGTAVLISVGILNSLSSAALAQDAARVVCFKNAMTDGLAAAIQARVCRRNSGNCSSWDNISIASGDTGAEWDYGQWDELKDAYIEFNIQGGGAPFFRGTEEGGRRSIPFSGDFCSGITVYICGNKDAPYPTNAVAASTDSGCQ